MAAGSSQTGAGGGRSDHGRAGGGDRSSVARRGPSINRSAAKLVLGVVFGLVILVIAVAAGGYLVGTRNKNIMTEPPADEVSTPEETGTAETSEQPDEAESTSE